ncbi:hypothetical protein J2X50_003863 [Aminobacter sp. BE322]
MGDLYLRDRQTPYDGISVGCQSIPPLVSVLGVSPASLMGLDVALRCILECEPFGVVRPQRVTLSPSRLNGIDPIRHLLAGVSCPGTSLSESKSLDVTEPHIAGFPREHEPEEPRFGDTARLAGTLGHLKIKTASVPVDARLV